MTQDKTLDAGYLYVFTWSHLASLAGVYDTDLVVLKLVEIHHPGFLQSYKH